MVRTGADRNEAAARRRRLTVVVKTPAIDLATFVQGATVLITDAQRLIPTDRRVEFVVKVRAPTDDPASDVERAVVAGAAANRQELAFGSIGLTKLMRAPALDRPINRQRAAMVAAEREQLRRLHSHGSQRLRIRNRRRTAVQPAIVLYLSRHEPRPGQDVTINAVDTDAQFRPTVGQLTCNHEQCPTVGDDDFRTGSPAVARDSSREEPRSRQQGPLADSKAKLGPTAVNDAGDDLGAQLAIIVSLRPAGFGQPSDSSEQSEQGQRYENHATHHAATSRLT